MTHFPRSEVILGPLPTIRRLGSNNAGTPARGSICNWFRSRVFQSELFRSWNAVMVSEMSSSYSSVRSISTLSHSTTLRSSFGILVLLSYT